MSATVADRAPTATLPARPETVAQRILRLQSQAKVMAEEHILELRSALETVNRLAAEVADGGPAYPVGVRELAGRLADEANMRALSIQALVARSKN